MAAGQSIRTKIEALLGQLGDLEEERERTQEALRQVVRPVPHLHTPCSFRCATIGLASPRVVVGILIAGYKPHIHE